MPRLRLWYAGELLPQVTTVSLFLMGPTSRGGASALTPWRAEALRTLESLGFTGEIFVPEPRDGIWTDDHAAQVAWEDAALHRADRVLVWLPRAMNSLPGLTTNDEWGFWKGRDPARLMLGTPVDAEHVRYQQYYAKQFGIPMFSTLEEMCRAVANEPGERREGGECHVPLHVWRTPAFQDWHAAQKKAGNALHSARVEWVFRSHPAFVFAWALHVDVFVGAEGRHKKNEVIIGRPNIAAVVLFHPGTCLLDTAVVLVREFRSASSSPDGFVWEVPSGSSMDAGKSPETVAACEVEEEIGLPVDPRSLHRHQARQLVGSMLVHEAQVFSLELAAEQITRLRVEERANTQHGVADQSEVTTIRVRTVREILADRCADWTTVGIIIAVLHERLGGAPTG